MTATVSFTPQAKKVVKEIMALGGFETPADAIRHALADELFIRRRIARGWTVLLRRGDDLREVVWEDR